MQTKSYEKWEVTVGKDKFQLDGNELSILKEATKRDSRGIVWFRDFAVSIPHIQSIKRTKNLKQVETELKYQSEHPALTTEQRKENLEKLAEIKREIKAIT